MKDSTILWLIGGAAVLYYGYQNNWFGNLTVVAPAVLPPVAPVGSGNMVPIAVLTPAQPAPVVGPPAPLYGAPVNGVPPPGVITPTAGGAGVTLDPRFPCPANADCSPLMLAMTAGGSQ